MDEAIRKTVLRMIPHGLQIVTVRDGDDVHGYTSSWLTQSSFDPPHLVLGVKGDSRSREVMKKGGVLCVHFLDKGQMDLAKRFFKPPEKGDGTLGGLAYAPGPATGCPVLEDALAHAECRVVHDWEGGDHHVVVAEVLDVGLHREGEALHMSDTPWKYGG